MEESVLRPACVAPSARLPTLARKTHSPAAGSAAGSRPDARVVSRGTREKHGARGFKTGVIGLGSEVDDISKKIYSIKKAFGRSEVHLETRLAFV